jgi:hypothetical protein
VLGTWTAPKKVRDEHVDDDIAETIRVVLAVLAAAA